MVSPSTNSTQFPAGYLEANNSGQLIAAVTTILAAATILLALRTYARTLTSAPRGWDDYCLGPAWLSLFVASVFTYLTISKGGVGQHVEAVVEINPGKVVTWSKFLWIIFWFYAVSMTASRLSVTFLYLRIFTSRWSRFWCWCMVVYLLLNFISVFVAISTMCSPVPYEWNKSIKGGKCDNYILWYQIYPFFNILADFGIAILPIKTIWNLKATAVRKFGILFVFSTGSVGLLASCMRTSEFFADAEELKTDPTWVSVLLEAWTIVEPGMYLCAACLVGLRPLFVGRGRPGPSNTPQTTFGLSSFRGHMRKPTAAHFKSPGFDELESSTHLANIDAAAEDGHRMKAQHSQSSLAEGQIRVNTEIEVRTEEGMAPVHGFDF